MKTPIVVLLCFTMMSMNVVCFADPNLNDSQNYEKGLALHQQGKYQDAYEFYFKDMSPTPKNQEWLKNYKAKYLGVTSDPLGLGLPSITSPAMAPGASNLADNCNLGLESAKKDAQSVGGGNLGGGVVLGLLLGVIGLVIGVAAAGPKEPPAGILDGKSADYSKCYTQTYLTETKSRKKNQALIGGVVGTAILVVLVVASSSSGN